MCHNALELFHTREAEGIKLDPRIRESFGNLLFKIGKDMVKRGNFPAGAEWLARALEAIDGSGTSAVSGSTHGLFVTELRFGIMQHLSQWSLV